VVTTTVGMAYGEMRRVLDDVRASDGRYVVSHAARRHGADDGWFVEIIEPAQGVRGEFRAYEPFAQAYPELKLVQPDVGTLYPYVDRGRLTIDDVCAIADDLANQDSWRLLTVLRNGGDDRYALHLDRADDPHDVALIEGHEDVATLLAGIPPQHPFDVMVRRLRVFRDLAIMGPAPLLRQVVDAIERRLSDGWARDYRSEEDMTAVSGDGSALFCFTCTAALPTRAAAALWLLLDPKQNRLMVTNIVPTTVRELSMDQYNAILLEFAERFAAPAARALSARYELSSGDKDIDDWLNPDATARLRAFARGANKSTGATHPDDRARWEAFVIAAHRGGTTLDAGTLRRWLIEVEGWPTDSALDLSIAYENGCSLLAAYDGRR